MFLQLLEIVQLSKIFENSYYNFADYLVLKSTTHSGINTALFENQPPLISKSWARFLFRPRLLTTYLQTFPKSQRLEAKNGQIDAG